MPISSDIAATTTPASDPNSRRRLAEKIGKLMRTGGSTREQTLAMALSMARSGHLGPRGGSRGKPR